MGEVAGEVKDEELVIHREADREEEAWFRRMTVTADGDGGSGDNAQSCGLLTPISPLSPHVVDPATVGRGAKAALSLEGVSGDPAHGGVGGGGTGANADASVGGAAPASSVAGSAGGLVGGGSGPARRRRRRNPQPPTAGGVPAADWREKGKKQQASLYYEAEHRAAVRRALDVRVMREVCPFTPDIRASTASFANKAAVEWDATGAATVHGSLYLQGRAQREGQDAVSAGYQDEECTFSPDRHQTRRKDKGAGTSACYSAGAASAAAPREAVEGRLIKKGQAGCFQTFPCRSGDESLT